ncbi:MAG: NAD(P)/FAD-dependent oxidoreductase [Cellulosilyticaceae bacterium]
MKRIIVVGGGASGLIAAIVAARAGQDVCIIERQNRIGKKILVTGNGRCNLTSIDMRPERFHTSTAPDCYGPIARVDETCVMHFFEELGMMPLVENNKVYPLSEQAASIVDLLRMEVEKLGIEVVLEEKVTRLKPEGEKWWVCAESGRKWQADRVIIATGGMAAPQLGCDQTGYKLLEKLGHHSTAVWPTLVHVVSPSPYCKMMQGTRMDCVIRIFEEETLRREEEGEVLFTEDGLSGPPIFQISRIASECADAGVTCKVTLDFFPKISEADMVGLCYDRIGKNPTRTIEELFVGWIHKRAIIPIIKMADVGSPVTPCENLDYEMIERLVRAIKCFEIPVSGTRGFKFAQATAGGIRLDEIDLETMASKRAKGVYITGEVLDVDGDCGGYNLQWAWSTGYIAGEEAAK